MAEVIDFKVIRIIEFTSQRKRMSILLYDPTDGYYKLYCKGADSVIQERLCPNMINEEDLRETDSFLRRASVKGLRTLLFSMKILDIDEVK